VPLPPAIEKILSGSLEKHDRAVISRGPHRIHRADSSASCPSPYSSQSSQLHMHPCVHCPGLELCMRLPRSISRRITMIGRSGTAPCSAPALQPRETLMLYNLHLFQSSRGTSLYYPLPSPCPNQRPNNALAARLYIIHYHRIAQTNVQTIPSARNFHLFPNPAHRC
jgi:hypothetical protein